jgi:single-stranded DNA-binding protein
MLRAGRKEWEPCFFTVVVWRDEAEAWRPVPAKGSRVVVVAGAAELDRRRL